MKKKRISFIRFYHGYTGGHQKVKDYITHFLALGWSPSLFLSNKALTNKSLFDDLPKVAYQPEYSVENADIVFLAGTDWNSYLPLQSNQKQVINLVQHVRHGDPENPLFQFLKQPAIRLCVSEAVKQAIEPHANGPCQVIKMGHRFEDIPHQPIRDVYILANKQPELGLTISEWLESMGVSVLVHANTQEHIDVIKAMSSSRVTVALPHHTEGFYLPGIEAMHYSLMAVIPNCIANKEYFNKYANILMPDYDLRSIKKALLQSLSYSKTNVLIRNWVGKQIVKRYTLDNERAELSKCLKQYFE